MKVSRRTAIKSSLLTGLGLMMPARMIADECLTTADIEGPYYIPGSPHSSKIASSGSAGTKLFITGSVYANDCTTPIKGAVVDVWQANDGGGYEDENYRGIIKTDQTGKYAFESILPGKYLNGSQYRPRHLHYKVSAPDIIPGLVLTTQIYFEGDTSIPIDPWASDPDAAERIIALSTDQNNAEHGVADIVIDIDPELVTGTGAQPAEMGTGIGSIKPNPVQESATVIIALARAGRASLKVYNLDGREIMKVIENKAMNAGEHRLPFFARNQYGLKLSSGIYIMKLWQEGIPADVKRFVVR
ncbi:MAG: T9SS type A sorting domain-containing protein [Bacteroidia bacterium]